MNWLLIAVICIIAWNVVRGYTRGVLRMVYSLAAWIVMLAASTMAAPYVRDQILSQTGIEPVILNGIEKQIAAQGQKATGDFDMANILLQQSGAYDTISAQLTNAIIPLPIFHYLRQRTSTLCFRETRHSSQYRYRRTGQQ